MKLKNPFLAGGIQFGRVALNAQWFYCISADKS